MAHENKVSMYFLNKLLKNLSHNLSGKIKVVLTR